MNKEILKKHSLEFTVKKTNLHDNTLSKMHLAIGIDSTQIIGYLLTEFRFTPSYFDSEVIPNLESVISGNLVDWEFDNDTVIVWFNQNTCSFFYDYSGKTADFNNPDYTCDTSDFLQIVLMWGEFQRTHSLK